MKFKKSVGIILCALLLSSSFAACSNQKPVDGEVVVVTDQNGETVTDKEGNAVTQIVTTDGSTTSTTSTTKSSTTTTKAGTSNTNPTNTATKAPLRDQPANGGGSGSGSGSGTGQGSNQGSDNYVYFDSSLGEDKIVLEKNAKGRTGSKNVVFDIKDHQGTCYINVAGEYTVTQTTDNWHGQIVIQVPNTESVKVRFENVKISGTSPSIIRILDTSIDSDRSFFEDEAAADTAADNVLSDTMKYLSKQSSAPNVDLVFPTGTTSSFETSANSYSGVIYNESKLDIQGNGKLNLKASRNKNNVICSTKSVTFKNLTVNLETEGAAGTTNMSSTRGIFSYSKVTIENAKVKIRSNGDGIRCDDLYVNSGVLDIQSGACDGVDADDRIIIRGGEVTSIALQKSSFKVRRINNQNDIREGNTSIPADDGVTKEDHVFAIHGGTVWGEGKNCSKTEFLANKHKPGLSTQVSLLIRSARSEDSEQARRYIQFNISGSGVNVTSKNKCGKFLYSSPSLSTDGVYTISSPQGVATKEISREEGRFVGNSGTCKIVSA